MEQYIWKRTGSRRLVITSLLLVAGVLAFASRASAYHDDGDDDNGPRGFSNRDFQGRYVASFQGTAMDNSVTTPVAAEGFLIADGSGSITAAKRTSSVGGVILRQTFTCTYYVNMDGTGSATCSINDGSTETYDFTLGDRGSEVRFIRTTDPNATGPTFVVLGSASKK